MDSKIYRPPPFSEKSSRLLHKAKEILQKKRRVYPGQVRDSIEYAVISHYKAELEGLDENNPDTAPLLTELEAREKLLGDRIYLMAKE